MICPFCKSEQIHAEKRGWKLTTGFIGSSKIILTCLDCGKQFKPGQQPVTAQSQSDTRLGYWVMAILLFVFVIIYSAMVTR